MADSRQNYYQALTTTDKLRGQFYTDAELVAMMLDALPLAPGDWIIDPSCGDGSFLRGAVAALARRFPMVEPRAVAEAWAERLIGFDVNPAAVAGAKRGLAAAFDEHLGVGMPEERFQIRQADVLAAGSLEQLLRGAGIECGTGGRLIVIGNPPYVEAKRLPQGVTADLKRRYPEAVSGAPDLYLYFLYVCLGWLGREDTLAFVLPNKLLVNANAQPLRERLLEEGRLRALWLATQAGLFSGASVYPIVLFASGPGGEGGTVEMARIARAADGSLVRCGLRAVDTGCYRRTAARAFFLQPEEPALQDALALLLEPGARLDDLLDIRWTVSFHRAGLRERYVTPHRPDDPSARPFVGGGPFTGNGEVSRYRLEWAGWWIRYDTAALQAEKNPLPDPAMFERPKLVICQNGRTLRVAYDETGCVLKDTFLCGALREGDHPLCRRPRALVGLLCSRAVHFFYSHVFYGGHVNGGYLHFLRSFLVDIPVGRWTDAAAADVEALVRQREVADRADWEALEEEIEARVSAAMGLGAAQQEAIVAWAATDPNWQARERVRRPRGVQGL